MTLDASGHGTHTSDARLTFAHISMKQSETLFKALSIVGTTIVLL